MKTGINHRFIPGPTNVPDDVRMAMNVPMQDPRVPEFGAFTLGILADLKRIFCTTKGQVVLFPASCAGA